MLCAFFFFVLLQVLAIDANNVSFDLAGASLLLDPGWVASSTAASGNFIFTDSLGIALTITLPGSTSFVTYVGLRRTAGSTYGVCVDCDSETTNTLQLVSGTDSTLLNNADAEPTTIFTVTVDPSQQHTLQITNVANNGEGEITFVSVAAVDQEASSTVFITASVSSSLTSTTSTPTITTTASTTASVGVTSASTTSTVSSSGTTHSAAPATASITGSSQTRTSLIALIVVLSLIAVSSLGVGLCFYLRKQRRRRAFFTGNPPRTASETSATLASSGFLAKAGRQKPPTRLPELYPYQVGVP